ncbi:MAG: hypothetical protein ACLFUR_01025 [Candidatus Hadarchaeia archaeon]
MSKIVAGVLPVLFLMSVLSAPVVFADSESRRSRPSPDRSERLRKDESFLSRHLHLRNGKLFLSGSERAALNAGISEDKFEAFKKAFDKLNDMKDEGYVTFEREKGQVMVHGTEKLEEELESTQEGPSTMATTPTDPGGGNSDGVTKYEVNSHWWGTSYEIWLNAADAEFIDDKIGKGSVAGGLISIFSGGVPSVVIGVFSAYGGYIGTQISEYNNGTGVVVSFNVTPVVPLPSPDVYSQ